MVNYGGFSRTLRAFPVFQKFLHFPFQPQYNFKLIVNQLNKGNSYEKSPTKARAQGENDRRTIYGISREIITAPGDFSPYFDGGNLSENGTSDLVYRVSSPGKFIKAFRKDHGLVAVKLQCRANTHR